MAPPPVRWLPDLYLFNNRDQVFEGYLPIFAVEYCSQIHSGLQSTPSQFFEKMQKFIVFIRQFLDFFRRHGDSDRKLMEKLQDKYRLVVINDDTFEEVTSMKLTPLAVYIAVSSLIVGTAILVVMLIVWTPVKRYIPGYGDFQRDSEIALLTSKVRDLEAEVEATRTYTESFRKLLTGDISGLTKEDSEKIGQPDNPADTLPSDVDRIPEDEKMRIEVEKGTFTSDPGSTGAAREILAGTRDIPLEHQFFIPPVSGDMTAGFDLGKSHFGTDIAAPKNTAIKSAADGVIIYAGYTMESGYSVAIQHPNNVVTMYKHNSVLLRQTGEAVKAGEAIAIIGNSGESTSGPHLHFELWYKGRPVNPAALINFR